MSNTKKRVGKKSKQIKEHSRKTKKVGGSRGSNVSRMVAFYEDHYDAPNYPNVYKFLKKTISVTRENFIEPRGPYYVYAINSKKKFDEFKEEYQKIKIKYDELEKNSKDGFKKYKNQENYEKDLNIFKKNIKLTLFMVIS